MVGYPSDSLPSCCVYKTPSTSTSTFVGIRHRIMDKA